MIEFSFGWARSSNSPLKSLALLHIIIESIIIAASRFLSNFADLEPTCHRGGRVRWQEEGPAPYQSRSDTFRVEQRATNRQFVCSSNSPNIRASISGLTTSPVNSFKLINLHTLLSNTSNSINNKQVHTNIQFQFYWFSQTILHRLCYFKR